MRHDGQHEECKCASQGDGRFSEKPRQERSEDRGNGYREDDRMSDTAVPSQPLRVAVANQPTNGVQIQRTGTQSPTGPVAWGRVPR